MKRWTLGLLVLGLGLYSLGGAADTTFTVGPGQDYGTIQAAVDAIPNPVDGVYTVEVYSATYAENVVVNKSGGDATHYVDLQVADGETALMTSNGGGGNVFYLGANNTRVDGFIVSPTAMMEGFDVEGSNVVLRNLLFTGGNLSRCIYHSGSLTVQNCRFQSLSYNQWYGHIYGGNQPLTIQDCIFEHNAGTMIYLTTGGLVQRCQFIGCDTGFWSHVDGYPVEFDNCTFHTCGVGVGSQNNAGKIIIIKNCIFDGVTTPILKDNNEGTFFTTDYNCVFESGCWGAWNYTYYYSLADWQSASGQDAHSLDSDPVLLDAGSAGFTLDWTSPCLDAGTYVELPYLGPAPDIGAAELSPTVKTVMAAGGGDFTSIQGAVDALPNPLDQAYRIEVYDGDYAENVVVNQSTSPSYYLELTAADGNTVSVQGVAIESDNVYVRHLVVAGATDGGIQSSGRAVLIENNTVYGADSGMGINITAGSATVRNNIIVNNGAGIALSGGSLVNDYNDVYDNSTDYDSTTAGEHSLSFDPIFVDPNNGDFHLQSTAGSYHNDGGWTTDAQNSPCIDAGDPASDCSLEPLPNNNLINLGAEGGTSLASLSFSPVPQISISAISVKNNRVYVGYVGTDAGGPVDCYWMGVDCEYAPEPYTTWQDITWATGDPLNSPEPLSFTPTGNSLTAVIDCSSWPHGQYKVRLRAQAGTVTQGGSMGLAATSAPFTGGQSTVTLLPGGDSYVEIQDAIDAIPSILVTGTVYTVEVHNATYARNVIINKQGEDANTYVAVRAATGEAPVLAPNGGTAMLVQTDYTQLAGLQISPTARGTALDFGNYNNHITVDSMRFVGENVARAVSIYNSYDLQFRNCLFEDLPLNFYGQFSVNYAGLIADRCTFRRVGTNAFYITNVGGPTQIRNCVFDSCGGCFWTHVGGSIPIEFYNCTYYNCALAVGSQNNAFKVIVIKNCLVAGGTAFNNDGNSVYTLDYNCVYPGSASFGYWAGTWCADLASWQATSGQDAHSMETDPLLTDPASGDFTLQPSSPCIDSGTDVGLPFIGSAPDIGAFESTPLPTATPTDTPTATSTITPTDTPSNTPSNTPTSTPTDTPTATPTDTPSTTPTATNTGNVLGVESNLWHALP